MNSVQTCSSSALRASQPLLGWIKLNASKLNFKLNAQLVIDKKLINSEQNSVSKKLYLKVSKRTAKPLEETLKKFVLQSFFSQKLLKNSLCTLRATENKFLSAQNCPLRESCGVLAFGLVILVIFSIPHRKAAQL